MALHLGTDLLVDDQPARVSATRLGLRVTGTVAVLVEAKSAGLLPSVMEPLTLMRQSGYWFSDALLMTAAQLAKETFKPG